MIKLIENSVENINNKILNLAITFETEKIKIYLKAIDTFEKLERYVYIYSKSFV